MKMRLSKKGDSFLATLYSSRMSANWRLYLAKFYQRNIFAGYSDRHAYAMLFILCSRVNAAREQRRRIVHRGVRRIRGRGD